MKKNKIKLTQPRERRNMLEEKFQSTKQKTQA